MLQQISDRSRAPFTACLFIAGIAGFAFPTYAQLSDAPVSINWNSGFTENVQFKDPQQSRNDLDRLVKRARKSHVIVHFQSPLTKADHQLLESNGLHLQSPLGNSSYFATITQDTNSAAIVEVGSISIVEMTSNHKLHKDLAQGVVRPWMLKQNVAQGDAQLQAMLDSGIILKSEFEERGVDPMVAVLVMFHNDEDYRVEAKRLANTLGGTVVSEIYSVHTVTMNLPLSEVNQLALDDAVQWVEPPLPPMDDVNAENRALIGADTLNTSPYDLDGTGVSVLVYDGGQARPHGDFGTRLTIGSSDTSGTSNHATHVAGTIGGDGNLEYANRGMAPGVDIISYGFQVEGGFQAGFLYSDPGDLEADYTEAFNLYSVDIANNSIGTNIEPNGYPCEWTGNYGITSIMIDSIVRGSLGEPMRIVWANGNERSRTRCLGDDFGNHGEFYSTAPPATAKNHITVGSVNSDNDQISYFSSWGPTDDGRIKPDISAPGCDSNDNVGVISTTVSASSGVDGYTSACGTSMAAPTVTGVCALILEQYRLSFPTRNDPLNSTLKAILANTAVDGGNVGPDYSYGYGSVRGVNAVNTVIEQNVIEGDVGQDGIYRFEVTVEPGETQLKVTAAWDDIPGAPNVSQSLINNLDLRIIDSVGNVYLPWTLDPANPSAPAIQTQADNLNNIEQVQIENPLPGIYSVEIMGTFIANAETQSFGAVSSSRITNCSSIGFVAMNESVVSCESGTTLVRVSDCDLNTSDELIEMVDVLVTSDSQPSGVVFTLVETQPDSAVFTALFSHDSNGSSDILVSDGDTITASYMDADTGLGSSSISYASMVVDCTPPGVIDRFVDEWYNYATVHIQADETVSCSILYGVSGEGFSNTLDSHTQLSDTHSLLIEDLTEFTSYRYMIELVDVVGNILIFDNNGEGFEFTTIGGPVVAYDYLVDDTDPGWERTGDWEFGNPTGLLGNPSEAVTGANILGYDLDDWFPWHMEEEYLTTQPMDFTGLYEVRLDFERWLGLVPDIYNNAEIRYRIGNGDWETIWKFSGGRISPSEWSHMSYLLPNEVNNQSDVQFRWVMGASEIHITECGWNIDDIIITGVVPPPPCLADINDDGNLDFFDISAFLDIYRSQGTSADFTGDGTFDFFDVSTFLSFFRDGCP